MRRHLLILALALPIFMDVCSTSREQLDRKVRKWQAVGYEVKANSFVTLKGSVHAWSMNTHQCIVLVCH